MIKNNNNDSVELNSYESPVKFSSEPEKIILKFIWKAKKSTFWNYK